MKEVKIILFSNIWSHLTETNENTKGHTLSEKKATILFKITMMIPVR